MREQVCRGERRFGAVGEDDDLTRHVAILVGCTVGVRNVSGRLLRVEADAAKKFRGSGFGWLVAGERRLEFRVSVGPMVSKLVESTSAVRSTWRGRRCSATAVVGSLALVAAVLAPSVGAQVLPDRPVASPSDITDVLEAEPDSPAALGAAPVLQSDARVEELIGLRTRSSKTYRLENGARETTVSAAPLHYRDADGSWVDVELVPVGGGDGLVARTGVGALVLPGRGDGDVSLDIEGGSLSWRLDTGLLGELGGLVEAVPVLDEVTRAVSYQDLVAGVTRRVTPVAAGVVEETVLERPVEALSWTFTGEGVTAELVGDTVIWSTASATLKTPAPVLYDAAGASTTSATVVFEQVGPGEWSYRIELPQGWLNNEGRVWPVLVDPSVTETTSDDCEIRQGQSSHKCGAHELGVVNAGGTQRRSLLRFDVPDALNFATHSGAASVTEAALQLDERTVTADGAIRVHALTEDWDPNAATWTNAFAGTAWSTAGGVFQADPPTASGTGTSSGGIRTWYPTETAQDWLFEDLADNGLIMIADPGVNVTFESSDSSTGTPPSLRIYWYEAQGVNERWQYEEFPLSDRRTARVNVGNGNFLVTESDLVVPGVAGHDIDFNRTHNSVEVEDKDFGEGWWSNLSRNALRSYEGGGNHVSVRDGTGRMDTFLKDAATGEWVPLRRTDATLTEDSSWFYYTENDTGVVYQYELWGPLKVIRDRSGNEITYDYVNFFLNTVTDTRGRVFDIDYASSGSRNITKITDPTGRTVEFTYTGTNGNRLATSTDAEGNTVTYAWDGQGNIGEIAEPGGRRTLITYVNAGLFYNRIESITRVTSGSTGPTTEFAYAEDCSTLDASYDAAECTEVTDPRGNVTVFYVDARSRVTKVVDANGREQAFDYDSDDNVIAYTPESAGTPFNSTYSTDGRNNLLSVETPTGATTEFEYADTDNPYAPSQVTTPQGDNTLIDYDSDGRVSRVTDPDTNTTDIAYNADGTVDTVTDPGGGVTDYTYNGDAELTTIDSPGPLGDVTFTYDTKSRVATTTDANGEVTTLTYDDMDRVLEIDVTGGPTVDFVYDALGNRTSRSDGVGTVTTTFDNLNRVTAETYPGSRNLSYVYDANGNLTSLTDPAGTTTYTYTNVDLVDELTVGTDVVAFTYDSQNRPDTVTYPNGVVIDSDYDASGKITSRAVVGPGPTTIEDWTWDYTIGGNDSVLVHSETHNTVTTTYSYDDLDRLTGASATGDVRSYAWDANNNRTSATINGTTTSWTFNAANQITTTGFTYDAAGNRTAGNSLSFTYDELNRTTDLDGEAAGYLGAGQNEFNTLDAETVTRALPGISNIGSLRYILTPSGQPIGIDDGTDTYWLHHDRLNSVVGITDDTGTEIVEYDYDPFGAVTVTGSAAIADQPIGFAGGHTERDSGLINFGARWYDPQTAAWTQPDPAGTPDGPNRYTYVNGNPTNYTDPTGLFIGEALAVGAVGFLAAGVAGATCAATLGAGCAAAAAVGGAAIGATAGATFGGSAGAAAQGAACGTALGLTGVGSPAGPLASGAFCPPGL